MLWRAFGLATVLLASAATVIAGQPASDTLTRRPWFEARTAYFQIFSCGPTQEVARLAVRLEQFRDAYSRLAGAQAVVSPPIVVMAFPDPATMRPFLPLYQNKPADLTAFFSRGSDQNLMVLPLSSLELGSLKTVFHEYTHLLLRLGQSPEQAFTNALRTTLPAMEAELRAYLARGKFGALELALSANVESPRTFVTRGLTPMCAIASEKNSCISAERRLRRHTSGRPGDRAPPAPCLTKGSVCWPPGAGSRPRRCVAFAGLCSSGP
jgi:hypothetical protein